MTGLLEHHLDHGALAFDVEVEPLHALAQAPRHAHFIAIPASHIHRASNVGDVDIAFGIRLERAVDLVLREDERRAQECRNSKAVLQLHDGVLEGIESAMWLTLASSVNSL